MTVPDIQLAQDADFRAIGRLHAQSWQTAYGDVFPEERLLGGIGLALQERWKELRPAESDLVLVGRAADDPSQLLGFCAIWCQPDPYLDNLHIAPGVRGQGVGKALLSAAVSHLLSRQLRTLRLTVFEANTKARSFYVGLGGRERSMASQSVFDVQVPCVEVVWSDLRAFSHGPIRLRK